MSILLVIPAEPGWYPGAVSVTQIGCTGHPVYVSAAGVSVLLTHPGMKTRCVQHMTRHELLTSQFVTPPEVRQQFTNETGIEITDLLTRSMRAYYALTAARR